MQDNHNEGRFSPSVLQRFLVAKVEIIPSVHVELYLCFTALMKSIIYERRGSEKQDDAFENCNFDV